MACCSCKDYMRRHMRIDPLQDRTCGKKKCHHKTHIGIKGRLIRSRPLLDLNKSTTAAASWVAAAAAASSSSSKDAATMLDLSPANLVKCSTSTADAAAAKTRPVKKKKQRPKFGAFRLGNTKIKKKKDVLP